MKRNGAILLGLAGVVTLLAGCDLRDYETRIDEQQKRVAILDEETRLLLADPIEMPKIELKDGKKIDVWPYDVFLRLPRGHNPKPAVPGYKYNNQDPQLFRYSGVTNYNIFLAAGLIQDEKKAEKDKADHDKGKDKPRASEWPIYTFRNAVRGALMDYYRKEYNANPDFPLFKKEVFGEYFVQPLVDRGVTPPRIRYDAGILVDNKVPAQFEVYFHQWDDRQFAIIIQIPLHAKTDSGVRAGIEWCLKSLEISNGAIGKRNALMARRNFRF